MNEERLWSIYIHINNINNKKYIGKAKGKPSRRWGKDGHGYLHVNKDGEYSQPLFAYAILKYGWDGFTHQIIAENLTLDEANQLEIDLIDTYQTTNPNFGYNITKGGGGIAGFHHTPEAKEKISQASLNTPRTLEWNSHISQSKIGHTVSQETRDKISASLTGRFCGEAHPNFGKKVSEASKAKMSEAHKGKCLGDKNGMNKYIVCVETQIVYASEGEAERQTGIGRKYISAAIIGVKQKTAGGYHWRYATLEEIEDSK